MTQKYPETWPGTAIIKTAHSPFNWRGQGSEIIASSPEMRKKKTGPNALAEATRDNHKHAHFSPPVIGGEQSRIDNDRNASIVGKRNDRRSQ